VLESSGDSTEVLLDVPLTRRVRRPETCAGTTGLESSRDIDLDHPDAQSTEEETDNGRDASPRDSEDSDTDSPDSTSRELELQEDSPEPDNHASFTFGDKTNTPSADGEEEWEVLESSEDITQSLQDVLSGRTVN